MASLIARELSLAAAHSGLPSNGPPKVSQRESEINPVEQSSHGNPERVGSVQELLHKLPKSEAVLAERKHRGWCNAPNVNPKLVPKAPANNAGGSYDNPPCVTRVELTGIPRVRPQNVIETARNVGRRMPERVTVRRCEAK